MATLGSDCTTNSDCSGAEFCQGGVCGCWWADQVAGLRCEAMTSESSWTIATRAIVVAVYAVPVPRAARRGDVFGTVSPRPGAGVRNEVSVRIGYPFSAESNPFARIGSDSFAFFTGVRANTNAKEWAWVDNEARQGALVNAMKRGNELVFKGTSERGTLTTDSYSLKGVTAAMKAIDKACSDG